MKKVILCIFSFLFASIPGIANADSVYVPNIPAYVTGTEYNGHYGLDININSGSITATNPSVSATGSSVPADATFVGAQNSSGNLVGLLTGQQTMANSLACVLPSNQSAIPVTQSGSWSVATTAPVNANGSVVVESVTTSEADVSAPSNTVAAVIEAESGNASNIRWGVSNSSTNILSSTTGMLMEPGRSVDYLPIGAGTYLHYISVASGTNALDIQWIKSQ